MHMLTTQNIIFKLLKLPAKLMYSSKRHLPLYKQIIYEIKLTIRKKTHFSHYLHEHICTNFTNEMSGMLSPRSGPEHILLKHTYFQDPSLIYARS